MASIEVRKGRALPFRVRAVVALRDPSTGKVTEARRSASFKTRGEAEEFARNCEVGEQDRRRARAPSSTVRGLNVEQAIERHLVLRRARGLTNVDDDENRANRIVADLGAIPVFELTRTDVRRWKHALETTRSARTGRILAAQTVKNHLNLLRTTLADCIERGELDENVAVGLRVSREAKEIRARKVVEPLSPSEFEALVRVAPRPLGLLITFAVYTGLRQGEMWALQEDDIVVRGGGRALLVRRGHLDGRATKSGRDRTVPLFGEAEAALDAWLQMKQALKKVPPELVFCTDRGAPLPQGKAPRGWFAAVEAAGIRRRVRWHDLRHTCGTWLAAGSVGGRTWSLHEVRDFLGHQNVQTTERYAHRREETLLRAVRESVVQRNAPRRKHVRAR